MTQMQQAIILTSVIGTILKEYNDGEKSVIVAQLSSDCTRFMTAQSGTVTIPFVGVRVKDRQKHIRFLQTVSIGDKIWKKAIDRYAKQSVTIEATALIKAVYDFAPDILRKHVNISRKKIDKLLSGATDGDDNHKTSGAVIGGYLNELLAAEMGIKINGRLSALKNKVDSYVSINPDEAIARAKKDVETIKGAS